MALWNPTDGLASVVGQEFYDFGSPAYHTVVGGRYSAVVERFGNTGRDASQATSGSRPLQNATGINGLPTTEQTLGDGTSLPRSGLLGYLTLIEADYGAGIGFYVAGLGGFTTGMSLGVHMYVYVHSTTTWALYEDDTLIHSGTSNHTNSGAAWWIGDRDNPDGWGAVYTDSAIADGWPGKLLECGKYSGTLTTADRNTLFGYGCWRAGIQANLPGGHPYAAAAPTTTTGDDLMGQMVM